MASNFIIVYKTNKKCVPFKFKAISSSDADKNKSLRLELLVSQLF